MALTFSPAIISYAGVSVTAGDVRFPTSGAAPIVWPEPPTSNINFPKANCRQVVILNTGATTLWFGSIFVDQFSALPPPFNPAGVGIIPTLGQNCTAIPAGGSFSLELDTFQRRGDFDPGLGAITASNFNPLTLMFYSAPPATNATATITYINTNGPF